MTIHKPIASSGKDGGALPARGMTSPNTPRVGTFSYPLSFEEQRRLSNEQMEAYIEWIFSRPLRRPMTDEERLDRDYRKIGSKFSYEWGE